jgi:hypothetical protein
MTIFSYSKQWFLVAASRTKFLKSSALPQKLMYTPALAYCRHPLGLLEINFGRGGENVECGGVFLKKVDVTFILSTEYTRAFRTSYMRYAE